MQLIFHRKSVCWPVSTYRVWWGQAQVSPFAVTSELSENMVKGKDFTKKIWNSNLHTIPADLSGFCLRIFARYWHASSQFFFIYFFFNSVERFPGLLQKVSAVHERKMWLFSFLYHLIEDKYRSLKQIQEVVKYTLMENKSILHF